MKKIIATLLIVITFALGLCSRGTTLSTVVNALEFGFACWGVIALIMWY